jgi:stage II sporulation protein D
MKGFGETARGVLGSVFLLAVLAGAAAWVFERAEAPHRGGVAPETRPRRAAAKKQTAAPSSAGGVIRVALTRQAVASVRLRVEGAYRVVPLGGGAAKDFDGPLGETGVSTGTDGVEIGGAAFGGEGVEVVPAKSPAVWVGDRQYRGSVRLHVTPDGRVWPVNVLPLEEYLAAVVDAEMPAAFPAAARQAQAVVARTYAVSCRREPPHRWFDLYATPVSQNYLGFLYTGGDGRVLAGETSRGRAAVTATAGLVCTYKGRLFRTFYSACCGGRTLSGAAVFGDGTPALCGVECGGCGDAPLFRWERSAGAVALAGLARSRQPGFGELRSATTDAGSRAALAAFRLSDGRRTVRLGPAEVKSALDLPSLDFELSRDGDDFVARGRGHGHGVGLCQWGAKGLAERGWPAERILKHYYPGCEVVRLR